MMISKGPQAFPRTEYLRRLAEVKSEITRRDIDALVVTNPSNIAYLTGYTARSFSVPQGLVVSIQQEEPTIILRKQDGPAAVHQTFMGRDKVIGYPEALIGNPDKDGYDALIDFLLELGVAKRGVGLELDHLPARSAEKFKALLPQARIVDCAGAVTLIRMVKSDLEISLMKEAAAITDAGIIRAAEVIRPGVREADAMAEIVTTLLRGANGKPGTWIANPYLCVSPLIGTSHIPWTENVLRDGSQANVEIAGVRHGYTAPISRTFSIGRPSDRLRRVHEAEVAGLEAGLATVRAGRTCNDVAQAVYRTIEKLGVKKESRCGYPVGIDWMERVASFKEGDMTVLKPNMTFHLHLGNWMIDGDEDFGYVISETLRVTESGVEVLTSAPRKLFEIT
ncbi:Xaa-Pro dipeptidase/ectoine hydrolase [Bradyrhizobium sp. Ghvi]|uniref:M24 family metallopeptidase n=1 Tax=Bradyrhizobium sp. Ghvi TaxID=1855319 RepID=UPI0008EB9BD6|nr:Xaa-Pro peptidase family protein [Bradyrhizobium sp. Ghvi]SFQ24544.1 Xaa-Pro dipeptidase/ectoine hydrolase [Bradyrhizobium sp. Ghvi]